MQSYEVIHIQQDWKGIVIYRRFSSQYFFIIITKDFSINVVSVVQLIIPNYARAFARRT